MSRPLFKSLLLCGMVIAASPASADLCYQFKLTTKPKLSSDIQIKISVLGSQLSVPYAKDQGPDGRACYGSTSWPNGNITSNKTPYSIGFWVHKKTNTDYYHCSDPDQKARLPISYAFYSPKLGLKTGTATISIYADANTIRSSVAISDKFIAKYIVATVTGQSC